MLECSYDPGATGNCLSFKAYNSSSYNKDTLFYNPKTGAMQPCVGAVTGLGKCTAYGLYTYGKGSKDQLFYDPKNKKMTTCVHTTVTGTCAHYDIVARQSSGNEGFKMTPDSSNPYYKRVPRTSQDLIDVGMRMLTGQCTLGLDC